MTTELSTPFTPAGPAEVPTAPESDPSVAPPVPHATTTTFLRPPGGWQLLNLKELWQFRDLLYFLAWRDVKVRYKQTALGALWAILQPTLMMVVFTIFFGRLASVDSAGLPYPIFVCAGLLPWTFFATAVSSASDSVISSARLITKVYFPRLAVPFAAVAAAVVDFAIACVLLLIMMAWHYDKIRLTPALALLPVIAGLLLLAAAGVGTLLAALNVRYRDFRYVIPFLLQVWMFATPSVYLQLPPVSEQTSAAQMILVANPMTGLIAAFRAAALGLDIPWQQLGIGAAASVAVFILGCLYFRKVEDAFADII